MNVDDKVVVIDDVLAARNMGGIAPMMSLKQPKLMYHPHRRTVRQVPSSFQFWLSSIVCAGTKSGVSKWTTKDWLSSSCVDQKAVSQKQLVDEIKQVDAGILLDASLRRNLLGIDNRALDIINKRSQITSSTPLLSLCPEEQDDLLADLEINEKKRQGAKRKLNQVDDVTEHQQPENDLLVDLVQNMIVDEQLIESQTPSSPPSFITKSNSHNISSDGGGEDGGGEEAIVPDDNQDNFDALFDDEDFDFEQRFAAKPTPISLPKATIFSPSTPSKSFNRGNAISPMVTSMVGVLTDGASLTAHIYDVPNWIEFKIPDDYSMTIEDMQQLLVEFNATYCHSDVVIGSLKTIFGGKSGFDEGVDQRVSLAKSYLSEKYKIQPYSSRFALESNLTPPLLYVSRVDLKQTCGALPDPNNPYEIYRDPLFRVEFQCTDRKYCDAVIDWFGERGLEHVNKDSIYLNGEIRLSQFMMSRGHRVAPEMWLSIDQWNEATVFSTSSQIEIYCSIYDIIPSHVPPKKKKMDEQKKAEVKALLEAAAAASEASSNTKSSSDQNSKNTGSAGEGGDETKERLDSKPPSGNPETELFYFERHDPASSIHKRNPLSFECPLFPAPVTSAYFDVEQVSNMGKSTHFPDSNLKDDKIFCINIAMTRDGSTAAGYAERVHMEDLPENYTFVHSKEEYIAAQKKTKTREDDNRHLPADQRNDHEWRQDYICLESDGTVPEWCLGVIPQYEWDCLKRFSQKNWMKSKFPVGKNRTQDEIDRGIPAKDRCTTPSVMKGCEKVRRICLFFDPKLPRDSPMISFLIPTLFQDDSCGLLVHVFPREFSCQMALRDFLVSAHPDIVGGHNVNGFDWKALYTRMNHLSKDNQPYQDTDFTDRESTKKNKRPQWKHLPCLTNADPTAAFRYWTDAPSEKCAWHRSSRFMFTRTNFVRKVVKTNARSMEFYYPRFIGLSGVDTLTFFKLVYASKYDSFTLSNLSKKRLKDDKVDLSIPMMNKCFQMGEYRPTAIYCDYDTVLSLTLACEADLISTQGSLANGSYVSIEQILKEGAVQRYVRLMSITGHKMGYFFEKELIDSPKTLYGGEVLTPLVGFYPVGVPTLDFAGHYTTAIRDFNLCMSTWVRPFDRHTFKPIKLRFDDIELLKEQFKEFNEVTLPAVYGEKTQPVCIAPYTEEYLQAHPEITELEIKRRKRVSNDFDVLFPRSSQCTLVLNPNLDPKSYEPLGEGEVCPVANFFIYRPNMYIKKEGDVPTDKQLPCRGMNLRGITPIILDDFAASRKEYRTIQSELIGDATLYCEQLEQWICEKSKSQWKNKEAAQTSCKLGGNSVYGAAGAKGFSFFGYMPNSVTLICRLLTKFAWHTAMTRWVPSLEQYNEMKKWRDKAVKFRHLYDPNSRLFEFAEYMASMPFPEYPDAGDNIDTPFCTCEADFDRVNPFLVSAWGMMVIYGDTDSIMTGHLSVLPDPTRTLTQEEIESLACFALPESCKTVSNDCRITLNDALLSEEQRRNVELLKKARALPRQLELEQRRLVIDIGKSCADLLTKAFRAIGLELVKIEFEKMLYPYIALAPKNYFGDLYENPANPKYTLQRNFGIKRDCIQFIRELVSGCISVILKTHSAAEVEKYIDVVISKLIATNGLVYDLKTISKFCMSKGLNKLDYDTPPSHVVANSRLQQSFPGTEFQMGDRIHFFYIDDPFTDKVSKQAMTLEQAKLMLADVKQHVEQVPASVKSLQDMMMVIDTDANGEAEEEDDQLEEINSFAPKSTHQVSSVVSKPIVAKSFPMSSLEKETNDEVHKLFGDLQISNLQVALDEDADVATKALSGLDIDQDGEEAEDIDDLLSDVHLVGEEEHVKATDATLPVASSSSVEQNARGSAMALLSAVVSDAMESDNEFLQYDRGDGPDNCKKPLVLAKKSEIAKGFKRTIPRYFLLGIPKIVQLCRSYIVTLTSALNAKMNQKSSVASDYGSRIADKLTHKAELAMSQIRGVAIKSKHSYDASSVAQILKPKSWGVKKQDKLTDYAMTSKDKTITSWAQKSTKPTASQQQRTTTNTSEMAKMLIVEGGGSSISDDVQDSSSLPGPPPLKKPKLSQPKASFNFRNGMIPFAPVSKK